MRRQRRARVLRHASTCRARQPAAARAARIACRKGDRMVTAMISDPKTFNPLLSVDSASSEAVDEVFEGLVRMNPKTTLRRRHARELVGARRGWDHLDLPSARGRHLARWYAVHRRGRRVHDPGDLRSQGAEQLEARAHGRRAADASRGRRSAHREAHPRRAVRAALEQHRVRHPAEAHPRSGARRRHVHADLGHRHAARKGRRDGPVSPGALRAGAAPAVREATRPTGCTTRTAVRFPASPSAPT